MKRFTLKRITALVLALVMTLSLCPVAAFAAGEEYTAVLEGPSIISYFDSGVGLYLTVNGNNVTSVTGTLEYDTEVLEYSDCYCPLDGWNVSASGDTFMMSGLENPIGTDTRVICWYFDFKDGVSAGTEYSVSFNDITLCDGSSTKNVGTASWSDTMDVATLDGPRNVTPGSEVTLTFNVPVSNLASAEATLEYDSSVLEYVSYENLQSEWTLSFNESYMSFSMWGPPLDADTELLSVTFRVKDDISAETMLNVTFTEVLGWNFDREFYLEDASWSGAVASASLEGSSAVGIGDTVTLTQTVTGNNIIGMETTLDFDASLLEIVSYDSLVDGWSVVRDGAKFTLTGENNPCNSTTDMLSVTFRVKETVVDKAALQVSFADTMLTDDSIGCSVNDTAWNAVARNLEAQWGLATGANNTGKPESWTSGTLNEAMIYANGLDSGTAYIQLLKDVDINEPLVFSSGKTTILDLNGHDIDRGLTTATSSGYVVKISGGNLTLCDTSDNAVTNPGKITGGYSSIDGGGVWVGSYQGNYGTFTMNSGAISGNNASHGGGVYVAGGCSFTINGGVITENEAACGGGVQTSTNAVFTMSGGSISENTARDDGGGVHILLTTATISGGVISGNTATDDGGGAYISQSTFTFSAGEVSDNIAVNGGGMYIYDSTTEINGGAVMENTATKSGGGVYFHSGTVSVGKKPVISGNSVGEAGSNLYLASGKTVTVNTLSSGANIGVTMADGSGTFTSGGSAYASKGYFTSDAADYAVIADGSNLKLGDPSACEARWGLATGENADQMPTSWIYGTLTDAMTYANGLTSGTAYIQLLNNVDTTAALIFSRDKATILDLNGKTIDRGLAEAAGGSVIYIRGNLTLCDTSSTVVENQGKITGGYSSSRGGGVHVEEDGIFTMQGGSIYKNSADDGGGVYVAGNSIFVMNGGSISGNTAHSGGGVYVSYWSGTFTMNGGIISENSAAGGGGVYVYGSSLKMTGGSISKNTASAGGGVYMGYWGIKSMFTMTGGTISGNSTDGVYAVNHEDNSIEITGGSIVGNSGAGVYVGYGSIEVSGTPYIFGNVKNGTFNAAIGLYEKGAVGKESNVYFPFDETVIVCGKLNDGALIGVTPYTVATNEMPATIATGSGYTLTASDAAKFVGDDGSFGALNSVNNTVELKLAKANLSGADIVAPGSEVTLLLNVSGTGIAGMEGTLEYDSNLLEYVRCKSVATDWEMTQNDATYVMTSDGAPVTSETGILAVTFRVKDTVSVGTQLNVSFKNATLTDGSNTFSIGDITWNGVADVASTDATLTGNEIVSAGSKVTLTMALSGDGITSAEMLLNYDDGVLEYVSYRALHNDWSVTKDGNKFTLTGEDRPISSAAADLLAVTFLVKRNVPVGAMVSAAFTNIVTSDGVVSSNVGTAFWRASVNGTTEAQWGLATGDNSDQTPTTWGGSGTLVDATYYANELTEGVAYIQLINDVVDTTAPLEFASGKTTVLDLNGNTIDRGLTKPTYDGNVITVKGNLTLCDTSAAATGKITGGNISGDYGSDSSGGGVIVRGTFTMNGGEISNNIAGGDGGGVYVSSGTFSMNGGTISNNTTNASYGYGGGVYVNHNGTFAMIDGTVSENAAHYGGGVYTSSTFTMSGGAISNNIVDGAGGGVYAYNTFTMTGGKISANTAGKNGGGVYGNLAMRGGTISGNNAENGGGVYGSGTMKLSGGAITGNTATGKYYDYGSYGYYNGGYGGGVYCSNLQIWGTPVITGNMATGILSGQSEVKDNWREQNVYLTGEKITVVSKLKDGASIGITASLSYGETSRVVVTGIDTAPAYTLTESDAAKFVGDPGCVLSYDSTNNAVVMGLRAQSYTVSGTITSYHNASDTITVGLYVGDSAVPRYVTTVTGNSASYSLVNVEPGTYTMKVSKADHPPYQCTVTVYNSNVLQNVALSYVPVAKKYTVTFVIDDEIVSTQTVEEGKSAVLPTIPAKENYDQVMPYWDKSGTNITSDTTITAVYTPNKYPVTFIADGVTVDTQTVEYGKSATLPKIPVKEGYDQTEPYWNHRGESITGSTVITAVYTINKYTVTFVAAGSVIGRQTVSHGGDATLPDVPPKEGESPITPYWNHDGKNITTDTIVSAVYTDEAYLVNGAVTSSLDSVGDVTVTLYLDSNPIAVYGATVNDNDGCYVIEGVESGTYTMKVSKPGYMTREYKVVVGSQAITQDVAICPKGDVNLDGEVNADDLTALARHVAKIEHLTDNYALQCADVDDNGMLSADDLTKLARYVAKIISTL